ncbi:MAG TPA: hypothetical protein VEA19_05790, partial [Actinomycetota bacterium]|nr:hypothetical protein [Actinomycetota bacterium]
MAARKPARGLHAGLTAVLLLLGFLVSAGVARERVREREEPQRRAALERLVRERQDAIRALSRDLAALDRQLESRRSEVATGSTELRQLLSEVEALEGASGAGPVSGPGVSVVLRDSVREAPGPEQAANLRVQDVDLQMTVNA